jgi:hypothetical protein
MNPKLIHFSRCHLRPRVFLLMSSIVLFLFCSHELIAQEKNENDVSFIYQTGYVTSTDAVKVLLISSHVLSFKEEEMISEQSYTLHSAAFRAVVSKIQTAETIQGLNSYDNIAFDSPVVETIGSYIHPSTALKYNLSSRDTKITSAVKIRDGIIEEHRRMGYQIYQIDFDPTEYEDYTYLKEGQGYLKGSLVRLRALSPLYVPFYRKGEIKELVATYVKSSQNDSGDITVESKKERAAASTTKKESIDYVIIAQDLEREGDAFVRSEGPFSKNALSKYREAYYYVPTEELRQKIANVSSLEVASAGVGEGAVALGDAFDRADIASFIGLQVSYSGAMEVEASPGVISKPYNVELLTANYRIIAYQLGFSYSSSATYQYSLQNQNLNPVSLSPAEFSIQSINATFGIGLGIPFKSFALYGIYGADVPLSSDYTLISTQYTPVSNFKDSFHVKLSPFFKFGLNAKIPKTSFALGVQYALRTVKSQNILELGKVNTEFKQDSQVYYLHEPLQDIYKYGLLGLNLMFVY